MHCRHHKRIYMRLVKSNQYIFHEICSGICCVIFFGQKCLICAPWSSLIYREVDSIKVLASRNCCSNTNAAAEVAPNQSVGFSFIFSPTLKIRKLFLVKKFSCDKRKRSWNGKKSPEITRNLEGTVIQTENILSFVAQTNFDSWMPFVC